MHLDIPVTRIKPIYQPNPTQLIQETRPIQHTINALHLDLHPEGGYFRETDRDTRQVPSSFAQAMVHTDVASRSVSSCILYFLTPQQPLGCFHRNNGRTVHVWQRGRGRYVIIHADEIEGQGRCEMKARVETFIVGPDVEAGERLQWVVEGGKYKSSFLLPDEPGGETSGLLITEVGLVDVFWNTFPSLRKP